MLSCIFRSICILLAKLHAADHRLSFCQYIDCSSLAVFYLIIIARVSACCLYLIATCFIDIAFHHLDCRLLNPAILLSFYKSSRFNIALDRLSCICLCAYRFCCRYHSCFVNCQINLYAAFPVRIRIRNTDCHFIAACIFWRLSV